MSENFICWKCGKGLTGVILPMSRREECASCGADQHVCKLCIFYDSNSRGSCDEERAESVSDTERANFCDYFKPSNSAFSQASLKKTEDAKAKLAALFCDATDDEKEGGNKVDDDEPDTETPVKAASSNEQEKKQLTPAQIAEQKLRDLLGG
jgi:hypothetical protein